MNDLSGLNLHPGGFGSSNKPEKRRGKKAEESMEHNSIAPSTGTIYFILKKYWKCSCSYVPSAPDPPCLHQFSNILFFIIKSLSYLKVILSSIYQSYRSYDPPNMLTLGPKAPLILTFTLFAHHIACRVKECESLTHTHTQLFTTSIQVHKM